MNKVELTGRLTKTPELKTTGNGVSVCSFTIAVNRKYRNPEGNYEADFINCVAWRQSAEYLCKHGDKGIMVGVTGSIQTRNYEKDGQRVYVTEISADDVEVILSAKSDNKAAYENTVPGDPDMDFSAFAPADGDSPF